MIKKTIQKEVYVSHDGKEFQSKEGCEKYEENLRLKELSLDIGLEVSNRVKHHRVGTQDFDYLFYVTSDITKDEWVAFLRYLYKHINMDKITSCVSNIRQEDWYLINEEDGGDYSDYLSIELADDVLQQYIEIMDLMKGE